MKEDERPQQSKGKLRVSREAHEKFFREMLGSVDEATAPFGLLAVLGDGAKIREDRIVLSSDLSRRLRERASKFEVSAASIWHLGYARMLASVSGQKNVVFGTLLSDRVLGLPANILPIRITIEEESVAAIVKSTSQLLAQ